jgi:anti-anti-sigma factor
MQVIIHLAGKVPVAILKGRMDALTSADVKVQLLSAIHPGVPMLIIDCSLLDYLSSAGIRVLYQVARVMADWQGEVVFCSTTEIVSEIFSMVGLDTDFKIFPRLEAALDLVKEKY